MTVPLFIDPPDHHELQARLVDHLAGAESKYRIVVSEVALAGEFSSRGRLDVVAVRIGTRYESYDIAGFEVKARRYDLRQDIRSDKWRKYLPQINRLAFAVAEELADDESLDELPQYVGIVIAQNRGRRWVWRRPAQKHGGDDIGVHTLLRIAQAQTRDRPGRFDELDRLGRLRRYAEMRSLSSIVSGRVRQEINDLAMREGQLENRTQRLERDTAIAETHREASAELAGLFADLSKHLHRLMGAIPRGDSWGTNTEQIQAVRAELAALTRQDRST